MRRKWQGGSWTPPDANAISRDGVWCRYHKKRHGYMTLGLNYSYEQGKWKLLWYCRETGDVLQEQTLHPVELLKEEPGD